MSLESSNKINSSEWSHVAVCVDETNRTLQLFVNGIGSEQLELPEGIALDLSDKFNWEIGGTDSIEKDFFVGKVDDLRFYRKALSVSEISSIKNDDVTDQPIVGYRKQVIYDDGDSENGLLVVNDEGIIRAQVLQNGSLAEVNSSKINSTIF